MEKNVGEVAANYFLEGFSCAEAVLMSLASAQGISSPLIPKIATAFGSGLSCTNGMCGALSGGILALSLVKGKTTKEDDRRELYSDVQELTRLFEKRFESQECTKLLGFSLSDADAGVQFVEKDCKNAKCVHYVSYVANKVNQRVEN